MLKLQSIDAGYGTFQALFDTTLEVRAGEAVAVIGPNGAGKTTLMRVISGMIAPWSGTIGMEGADVLALPPHRIIELGIAHVPENRRLFPRLTVEGNLRMGAFTTSARAKFARRLEFVFDLFPRLKERRNQLAGTMSGGEQQMCAIGRALMSEPKLLLLDEPSAGLAPVVVQQVFELVRRIRAGGLTVLIVELSIAPTCWRPAASALRARHRSCWRAIPSRKPIWGCEGWPWPRSSTSISWRPSSTASSSAACWR
jgi:branched-chain amino acid transport system ATP-binding protein